MCALRLFWSFLIRFSKAIRYSYEVFACNHSKMGKQLSMGKWWRWMAHSLSSLYRCNHNCCGVDFRKKCSPNFCWCYRIISNENTWIELLLLIFVSILSNNFIFTQLFYCWLSYQHIIAKYKYHKFTIILIDNIIWCSHHRIDSLPIVKVTK